MTIRFPAVMAAAAALLLATPAAGRQAEPAAAAAAQQPVEPVPATYEIAARARLVSDSADRAARQVERVGDPTAISADLADAERRQRELQLLLATIVETDYIRPERMSRLRDQTALEDQRLEGIRSRAMERLQQLGEMRTDWTARQRAWHRWRTALRTEPDYRLLAGDVDRTIARIDSVTARISGGMTQLLALQQRIEEVRGDNAAIASVIAAIRTGRRQALLQRAEPVLLSGEHRRQLSEEGAQAWRPAAALRPDPYVSFVRGHAGLLIFHALLIVVLAFLARRLQRVARPEDGWSGLLARPWALGVFSSSVLALQRVTLAPPLWDVAVWALFAAAAAALAGALLATRALRLTVYLFAAFYPAFLLLEVAGLAAPVFRIVIAAVAALALPVFALHARRRTAAAAAEGSADPHRLWPLRIGAAMWAVVLVAVVLGYDLLGRWVLHATVTSAAVVLIVVLFVALLRGMIATLLRTEARGTFLRNVAVPFAQRLGTLLQGVLIAGAALVLLAVWELAPSPVTTWQAIISAGFNVGPLHITVGRLLGAVIVLYIVVLLSWLTRTFLHSEAYRRWHFDRGVSDSISMLVHYTFIVIGAVIALAVIGVELQNFAIIAGALGIGIGFGLQNVVNNFASGLILLFERPVRVGDTVIVGGEWGTIRKIGLRSTIMLTFDQSEMIVPNADLVSEKVVNWTLSSPIARIILPVGVAYGSSIPQVLEILRAAGTAHDGVLEEPPPQALFAEFGDSSLDFELRLWVREIRLRLEVRSVVLTEVERRLAEAGIEIPFPQRDLHLRSIDAPAADLIARR
jgi:potassium-dependent mechanosensitive channel